MTLSLYDHFNTLVIGELLDFRLVNVSLTTINNIHNTTLHATSFVNTVNSQTGSAVFENLTLSGPNNSTVTLHFGASPISGISAAQCGITLSGCNPGYVVTSAGDGNDICQRDREKEAIFLFLVTLLVVILILASILSILAVIEARKRLIQRRYEALEIPDFNHRARPTLNDILDDPSIPRLLWSQVHIGDAIGKGASGLVRRGVWSPRSSGPQEIALKELIVDSIDSESYDQFLVEIKYMRFVLCQTIHFK